MHTQTRKILQDRAELLAREESASAAKETMEVVEFNLCGERYAVPMEYVREITPLKDLTQIPGTPPHIVGMINLRGQILSVIDLGRFFDIERQAISDLTTIIVVKSGEIQYGILADSIVGTRVLDPSALQTGISTFAGLKAEVMRGVTPDQMILLDAPKLLSHEAVLVRQE